MSTLGGPVHRVPYETLLSPEQLPQYSLVEIRDPQGRVLEDYRGVRREDSREVVSVVSARYGLVGHRDVARAVHDVGQALEASDPAVLLPSFPRESIRLYAGGRRMEVKLVVGRRFQLENGDDLYPGLRVLNSLDGSWAVRLSGFAVRLACQNQLYAQRGNVSDWRELHLSTEGALLPQLARAIYEFLDRFPESLEPYRVAMHAELLASEVEPALCANGLPRRHAAIIGARVEALASHVSLVSRWTAYQVATAYLTRETRVNPDREREFERSAAGALLLPSRETELGAPPGTPGLPHPG
jgi:uncharacterized protein DUF932